MLKQSPSEVVSDRIADIESSRNAINATGQAQHDQTMREIRAFNCAAIIAISAIRSAAESGNVQCIQAQKEMDAFLIISLKPDTKK